MRLLLALLLLYIILIITLKSAADTSPLFNSSTCTCMEACAAYVQDKEKYDDCVEFCSYNTEPIPPCLCYCGMRITQYDLDQYLSNQHILNRSFLSASMNREVAEMFASEGQQSKMRHTPKDHRALQYSCLCKYLIKQNSTAINIQSLSTRPDEKEILILPFTVFKIIAIKQNYLDDPTASISVEIVLEEYENPNDNKNESENSEIPRTSSLSSTNNDIKDVDECTKVKQRKRRLYGIIGCLVFAILLALTFIFIFIFVIKKGSTNKTTTMATSTNMTTSASMITSTNMATSTTENNNGSNYTLLEGCPKILERSSWNARPYKRRENLRTSPVTDIVVHKLGGVNSTLNHRDCIKEIKKNQDYQMDTQKWDDIGYNFLLCDDCDDQQQIYTGRGWKFTGAHCKSYNAISLGKNTFLF
ncbi:unnamed protein product [Rotaria sp. Silwood2]|nr:unnamed protein product [Rotaria sp. Silwood2]